MKYTVREIQQKDNSEIESIIRACLVEFGANHDGTVWTDPDLKRLYDVYRLNGNKYWVAQTHDGKIVGGVGIGRLKDTDGICELQKMYCLPEARGTEVSHDLIKTALAYAENNYKRCYLETMTNMVAAQRFYEKYGFVRIYKPIVKTGHFACDVRYIKDLKSEIS